MKINPMELKLNMSKPDDETKYPYYIRNTDMNPSFYLNRTPTGRD